MILYYDAYEYPCLFSNKTILKESNDNNYLATFR